jgi:hypothetical protein
MTTQTPLSGNHVLPVSIFFGSSFVLHLLWENLQAPLYAGFQSSAQQFWICFKATWGDLLFMACIYVALAIIHRDPFWVADRAAYALPATWIIALLVGGLLAVNLELWAVHVDHRWQYTETMPLIPVLRIGLTPVLQMMVIPLAAIAFTSRFSRSV